jgi:AraC-like DNA-binding protein
MHVHFAQVAAAFVPVIFEPIRQGFERLAKLFVLADVTDHAHLGNLGQRVGSDLLGPKDWTRNRDHPLERERLHVAIRSAPNHDFWPDRLGRTGFQMRPEQLAERLHRGGDVLVILGRGAGGDDLLGWNRTDFWGVHENLLCRYPKPMKETSRAWTILELGGLEVMHASFVRHQFAKHSHETFTVVLIDDGASKYWYRGAEHVVGAGMVSLLNPDEVHTGTPVTPAGYSQRSLYLEPERLWAGLEPRFFRDSLSRDANLYARIGALHDAIPGQDDLELPLRLSLVTENLLHIMDARAPQATPIESDAVRHLRELIEDDPAAQVQLEMLAASLGSSCAHLSRAFTRTHGLPPHAYRLQARLEQAKPKLLAGTSAAQVALELGFNSQSHFITQFKRWTGVTPGHYRTG